MSYEGFFFFGDTIGDSRVNETAIKRKKPFTLKP